MNVFLPRATLPLLGSLTASVCAEPLTLDAAALDRITAGNLAAAVMAEADATGNLMTRTIVNTDAYVRGMELDSLPGESRSWITAVGATAISLGVGDGSSQSTNIESLNEHPAPVFEARIDHVARSNNMEIHFVSHMIGGGTQSDRFLMLLDLY